MQTTSSGYVQRYPQDEFDDLCAMEDNENDPGNEVRVVEPQLWHHQGHATGAVKLHFAMQCSFCWPESYKRQACNQSSLRVSAHAIRALGLRHRGHLAITTGLPMLTSKGGL